MWIAEAFCQNAPVEQFSSVTGQLLVPRAKTATRELCAFSVVGSSTWNGLLPENESVFSRLLKTDLYRRCWAGGRLWVDFLKGCLANSWMNEFSVVVRELRQNLLGGPWVSKAGESLVNIIILHHIECNCIVILYCIECNCNIVILYCIECNCIVILYWM